ncbi:helix-turn-helix domain-containing protein [Bartonella sp. LJL80]
MKNRPPYDAGETGPIDKEVGANLQRLRVESGLSPADLGAKLHCSAEQIEAYEAGKIRIGAIALQDLCEIFSVSVSCFFDNHLTSKQQVLGDLIHAYVHDDMPLPDDVSATEMLAHIRCYLKLSRENRAYVNKTTLLLNAGF